MLRQIIRIDEDKCNGCGICATACHEGAISIIDGKARLTRDDYCDGMGDCLPACPTGAISFETREAAAYDENAVLENKRRAVAAHAHGGCPGSAARIVKTGGATTGVELLQAEPQLRNWPVQIKLAPVHAPYFDGADLLIAADCTAFAYASFHEDFIKGRITLIGCPKLDGVDYTEKLAQIILLNDISSVTIARMEVPCCGGLEMATRNAVLASDKDIPLQVVTISIDGKVLE